MIETVQIDELPYSLTPDVNAGQKAYDWIRRGECPDGAVTKGGHEGTLNRPTYNVSESVEASAKNTTAIAEKLNEVVVAVNTVNDTLGQQGSTDLITQVNQNTTKIAELVDTTTAQDESIQEIQSAITDISETIGATPVTRTLTGEIQYLKNELGSYPGFDVDGNADPDSTGTGVKYSLSVVKTQGNNTAQRVQILEEQFTESDVGALQQAVSLMRDEIGDPSQATLDSIYTRLDQLKQSDSDQEQLNTELKQAIDFSADISIGERVNTLESESNAISEQLNTPSTGIAPRVVAMEQTIGDKTTADSILWNIDQQAQAVDELTAIVGDSGSTGLRGSVADINAEIGNVDEPSSIVGTLAQHNTSINQLSLSVQQVQQTLGDSDTGIVAAVDLMGKEIYGDPAAPTELERDGLKTSVSKLSDAVGNKLSEPDSNGTYIFRDGDWFEVIESKLSLTMDTNITGGLADTPVELPVIAPSVVVNSGFVISNNQITFENTALVCVDLSINIEDIANDYTVRLSIGSSVHDITDSINTRGSKQLFHEQFVVSATALDQVTFSVIPKVDNVGVIPVSLALTVSDF